MDERRDTGIISGGATRLEAALDISEGRVAMSTSLHRVVVRGTSDGLLDTAFNVVLDSLGVRVRSGTMGPGTRHIGTGADVLRLGAGNVGTVCLSTVRVVVGDVGTTCVGVVNVGAVQVGTVGVSAVGVSAESVVVDVGAVQVGTMSVGTVGVGTESVVVNVGTMGVAMHVLGGLGLGLLGCTVSGELLVTGDVSNLFLGASDGGVDVVGDLAGHFVGMCCVRWNVC